MFSLKPFRRSVPHAYEAARPLGTEIRSRLPWTLDCLCVCLEFLWPRTGVGVVFVGATTTDSCAGERSVYDELRETSRTQRREMMVIRVF